MGVPSERPDQLPVERNARLVARGEQEHGHALAVLQAMSLGHGDVRGNLSRLEDLGWARQTAPREWALTAAGRAAAARRRATAIRAG